MIKVLIVSNNEGFETVQAQWFYEDLEEALRFIVRFNEPPNLESKWYARLADRTLLSTKEDTVSPTEDSIT